MANISMRIVAIDSSATAGKHSEDLQMGGLREKIKRDYLLHMPSAVMKPDQVPREYMSLDVPVVRAAIAQDGIRHIPGLRIFQTEGLRVRAATSPRSHKPPSEGEQAVGRPLRAHAGAA